MRLTYIPAIALFALAYGCGGDDGELTLHLYDAPPANVTAVKISIASMDAHVAKGDKTQSHAANDTSIDNDDSWKSLDVNATIDLLQHQGESAAIVLGKLPLPEGKITQIRLVIDTTKPNTATVDGVDCDLDTSLVEAKGIKINHVFKAFSVAAGEEGDAFVHFDLEDSLAAQGDCFRLEPKIKLEKVVVDGDAQAL